MSTSHAINTSLQSGLDQLKCHLDSQQQQRLLDYIALLDKWNRTYNLTAVRALADMVGQHLLDSLSIRPFLHGDYVLDVGTGPGLPGIPLAISEPGKFFVLLDSNSKKTRFMTQATAELGLDNVQVVHSRIEAFTTDQVFTTIVSRAFATLADFINGCEHLCSDETVLLAMKGKHPQDEIAELPITWKIETEQLLQVPLVEGERRVMLLKRNN